jgi:hypothetical protein
MVEMKLHLSRRRILMYRTVNCKANVVCCVGACILMRTTGCERQKELTVCTRRLFSAPNQRARDRSETVLARLSVEAVSA